MKDDFVAPKFTWLFLAFHLSAGVASVGCMSWTPPGFLEIGQEVPLARLSPGEMQEEKKTKENHRISIERGQEKFT